MPAPKGHPPYNDGLPGRPLTYTVEELEKMAKDLIIWMKEPSNIFFAEFALSRGHNSKKMKEWCERSETFREAYHWANEIQEIKLKKGSLHNVLNTCMAKFCLVNNHGMKDKTEQTIVGEVDNPVSFIMNKVKDTSKDLVNEK